MSQTLQLLPTGDSLVTTTPLRGRQPEAASLSKWFSITLMVILELSKNVLTVCEQQFFKVMDGEGESNLIVCSFNSSLLLQCDGKVCLSFTAEAFGFSVLIKYA